MSIWRVFIKILYVLVRSSAIFSLPLLRSFRNIVYQTNFGAVRISVSDFVLFARSHSGGNAWLRISEDVEIGRFAHIDYSGGVVIGRGCAISEGAKIFTHNHGVRDGALDWSENPIKFADLKLGEFSWIGAGAIILAGAKEVGRGAIVAAGAVVVSPVPDLAIVAGVPAKVVGYRNVKDWDVN